MSRPEIKSTQKGRLLTEDEVRARARTAKPHKIETDPYGFFVATNDKGEVVSSLATRIRKRGDTLFAKAYPKMKDYANAYGVGLDMAYHATRDGSKPLPPVDNTGDNDEHNRSVVKSMGKDYTIWNKAFSLGRRDGYALKIGHIQFRKTGVFPKGKLSNILEVGKTVTASDDEEQSLSLVYMRPNALLAYSTDYGHWITHEGQILAVENERHAREADRWLRKNMPDAHKNLPENTNDNPFDNYEAFDYVEKTLGWIHIVNHNTECGVMFTRDTVSLAAYNALKTFLNGSDFETFHLEMRGDQTRHFLHKTYIDPKPLLDIVYKNRKKSLTAILEAAELEVLGRSGFAKPDILYHGTSSTFLQSILKHGLDTKKIKEGRWLDDADASERSRSRQSYGGTYFTPNVMTARSSATNLLIKMYGLVQNIPDDVYPIIVCAQIQPRDTLPDEDNYTFGLRITDAISDQMMPYFLVRWRLNKLDDETKAMMNTALNNLIERFAPEADKRKDVPILLSLGREVILTEIERRFAYIARSTGAKGSYSAEGKIRKAIERIAYPKEVDWDAIPRILRPYPKAKAENRARKSLDLFIKKTRRTAVKKLSEPHERSWTNVRSLKPITFKGANKIICIVREEDDTRPDAKRYAKILRVLYGKLPDDFLKQYMERVTDTKPTIAYRNEIVALDVDFKPVKNPSPTKLRIMLKAARPHHELRGLIHGQDVWFWSGENNYHADMARELGQKSFDDYGANRLKLYQDREKELWLDFDDSWTNRLAKIPPLRNILLGMPDILVHVWQGHDPMTGPQYVSESEKGPLNTTLEAAVSFLSNKKLDQRHKAFFSKMTLGFESEIAFERVRENIDMYKVAENFEKDFYYTESQFLSELDRDQQHLDVLYGLEPKYGKPTIEYLESISDALTNARFSFRVMQLLMKEGPPIMEEPSLSGYEGYAEGAQFRDGKNSRPFDPTFVIKTAEEQKSAISVFMKRFPVVTTKTLMTLNINEAPGKIAESLQAFQEGLAKDNIVTQRIHIYLIGKAIHAFSKSMRAMLLMAESDSRHSRVVLDENGALEFVQFTSSEKFGGINSDSMKWSDSGKDDFEEDFEEAQREEYNRQFQVYLDNLNETEDESPDAGAHIHDLVLDEVDGGALFSEGYHDQDLDAQRGKTTIVERDGSIEPSGAEVVSPVFEGPKAAFAWLNATFTMIDKHSELTTNDSTGLHVNVGTFHPFIKTELRDPETLSIQRPVLDAVKLVALSGDKYLLKQFGRLGNTYAKELTPILKGLGGSDFDFQKVAKSGLFYTLRLFNNRLLQMQADRHVSINLQHLYSNGYIEFRIAGGKNYHRDTRKIERTVYRFMQLCAVACDPKAYFKDYMKALYRTFVDNTGPMATNMMPYKTPMPKNVDDALTVLELWNNKNSKNGYGPLPATDLLRLMDARIGKDLRVMDVLTTFSGLSSEMYSKVDNGVLQALRLLMLYAVRQESNPKAALEDIWNKHRNALARFGAPKMMQKKPNWLRFLYTGRSAEKTITSSLQTVYHYTSIYALSDILTSKGFRLSTNQGTQSDQNAKAPYFFSMTRSKVGGFHTRISRRSGVLFELDYDYLKARYPIEPRDYWGPAFRKADQSNNEMEETLWSQQQVIPLPDKWTKLFKSVHILAEKDEGAPTRLPYMMLRRAGVPVYVYDNVKFWQAQQPAKALTGSRLVEFLKGPERKYYQRSPRNYFAPYLELWHKPLGAVLSKDAERVLYKVKYDFNGDAARGLEADVHNARSRPEVAALVELLRRHGGIKGFLAALKAKYDKVEASGRIPLYRGESSHNKGGAFWTEDREFAKQFTQSGLDKEVRTRYIDPKDIDERSADTYAGNEDAVNAALESAKKDGFKAIRLSEGKGESPSVWVFNKAALKFTASEIKNSGDDTVNRLNLVKNRIRTMAPKNTDDIEALFLEAAAKKGASESSQSYTNTSKNVKLIFYAKRSTAQTCKPGQTVKGKAGFGKRTRVRNATPAEVAQLKKGVWLRTREDNKKPNEEGAKKTAYRPHLVKGAMERVGSL